MKFNYTIFIIYFVLFFLIRWGLDWFAIENLFSIFLTSFVFAFIAIFFLSKKPKLVHGLNLKTLENEEIYATYFVTLRFEKEQWLTGNLFITNKRIYFADKRFDIQQTDYEFQFDDLKQVNFLPMRFFRNESIQIINNKNQTFKINAFHKNKELFEKLEQISKNTKS